MDRDTVCPLLLDQHAKRCGSRTRYLGAFTRSLALSDNFVRLIIGEDILAPDPVIAGWTARLEGIKYSLEMEMGQHKVSMLGCHLPAKPVLSGALGRRNRQTVCGHRHRNRGRRPNQSARNQWQLKRAQRPQKHRQQLLHLLRLLLRQHPLYDE